MGLREDKVGHLEEEALKRKERLKRLRAQAVDPADVTTEDHSLEGEPEANIPLFRSYRPTDNTLKQFEIADVKPNSFDNLVAENAAPEPKADNLDVTLLDLAPRKPDWGLQQGIAEKLSLLQKRTQRSIALLVRRRLQQSEDLEGLAAVSVVEDGVVEDEA